MRCSAGLRCTLLAAGMAAAGAAPAPAAELLATTVGATGTTDRVCHERLLAPGTAGIARRGAVADANGLVRARLSGDAATDWDLAVFDAVTGRAIAGSAHFASTELAEGVVAGGQPLVVQACRRAGPAGTADVTVTNVALPPAPAGTLRLVRVEVPNRASMDLLDALNLDLTEHGRPGYLDVLLHGDADLRALQSSGLAFSTLEDDVVAADRAARSVDLGPPDGTMPSGRVDYRRLPDFGADMKKLAADNPTLVKAITLALPSLEGRPVEGVEITRNVQARDGKPVFVQLGVHHAREWPSAEMPLEFAFELVNRVNDGDERAIRLLDAARVIVVPIVNPDGYNLSREAPVDSQQPVLDVDFAYKRKNCRVVDFMVPAEGECGESANREAGTDPNRNYGGFWGGPGAARTSGSDTYRGAGPFSEPESENVRRLVSSRQATTLITNHTYSDLVLRPPGVQDGPQPPDETLYKQLGDAMAAENGYSSIRGWELYDTTGTTEDWSYFATGGLGFTFEIGKAYKDFNLVGVGFHPAYPIGVVGEWFGKYPTGGGNREAYYVALESTVDATRHSVIAGRGPAGSVIRLRKEIDAQTLGGPSEEGGPVTVHDVLDTTMVVPDSGAFEYHANPSTRPLVQLAGGRETWTLTCETPNGGVIGRRDVAVARGERVDVGEVCGDPPKATPVASPLTLKIRPLRTRLRALAKKGLLVRATCSEGCDLAARLRQGRRTIGRRSARAAVGITTLRIKVARKQVRRLVKRRRATLRLQVTGTSASGARATVSRKLVLRR